MRRAFVADKDAPGFRLEPIGLPLYQSRDTSRQNGDFPRLSGNLI